MEEEESRSLRSVILVEDVNSTIAVFEKMADTVWKESSSGKVEMISIKTLKDLKELLENVNVDVVLLDLNLEDASQEETLEFIESRKGKYPVIIAISTNEDISVRKNCLFCGAGGFMLKKHIIGSPNFFFSEMFNIYEKSKLRPC